MLQDAMQVMHPFNVQHHLVWKTQLLKALISAALMQACKDAGM